MDPRKNAEASHRFSMLQELAQALHVKARECVDPLRAHALYQQHARVLVEMMEIPGARMRAAQQLLRGLRR